MRQWNCLGVLMLAACSPGQPGDTLDSGQTAAGGGGSNGGGGQGSSGGGGAGGGSGVASLDAGRLDPGCSDATACTSGVCLASHDCVNCQDDLECATGSLCGTGACSASCGDAGSCAPGWDCCAGRCTEPTLDPAHCGQCTTTCTASQFCGLGQCRAPSFENLCRQATLWVVHDPYPADNAVGDAMAAALASTCGLTAATFDGGSGVQDPLTGEPLQLGTVLVTPGGTFGQTMVGWLQANRVAPVVAPIDGPTMQYTHPDGGVIASAPWTALNGSHDIVVVQLIRAPGGALVLNGYGVFAQGTTAAGWYFVNKLLPTYATLTQVWYVVDWSDTSGDGQPGAGDTWTVLASGT
jgi:Stigma-specific protein, Stig1